jgi:hypothetical protein
LRLRAHRVGGGFGKQHGCTDEKTCTALTGTISMAADAMAIHKDTHFRFTSKS